MPKKVRRKIRRPKRSTKPYFDKNTHDAIVKFQNTEERDEKEKIYVKEILPAFNKLAENLIFIHGFAKPHGLGAYEGLKSDCVTFLYETLRKFDPSRGTKAFSYFNVVAKNWLIIQSKKKIKSNRRHVSISDSGALSVSDLSLIENFKVEPSQDDAMIKKEAISNLFDLMVEIRSRLKSENELACMDAILTIFSRIDDLDLLNKRAVFVYMRNLSNLNPKQLSVAMSVIRKHYKELVKTGEFDIFF
jgi:hypothetical protein